MRSSKSPADTASREDFLQSWCNLSQVDLKELSNKVQEFFQTEETYCSDLEQFTNTFGEKTSQALIIFKNILGAHKKINVPTLQNGTSNQEPSLTWEVVFSEVRTMLHFVLTLYENYEVVGAYKAYGEAFLYVEAINQELEKLHPKLTIENNSKTVNDFTIKPMQRITKIILFLKDFYKILPHPGLGEQYPNVLKSLHVLINEKDLAKKLNTAIDHSSLSFNFRAHKKPIRFEWVASSLDLLSRMVESHPEGRHPFGFIHPKTGKMYPVSRTDQTVTWHFGVHSCVQLTPKKNQFGRRIKNTFVLTLDAKAKKLYEANEDSRSFLGGALVEITALLRFETGVSQFKAFKLEQHRRFLQGGDRYEAVKSNDPEQALLDRKGMTGFQNQRLSQLTDAFIGLQEVAIQGNEEAQYNAANQRFQACYEKVWLAALTHQIPKSAGHFLNFIQTAEKSAYFEKLREYHKEKVALNAFIRNRTESQASNFYQDLNRKIDSLKKKVVTLSGLLKGATHLSYENSLAVQKIALYISAENQFLLDLTETPTSNASKTNKDIGLNNRRSLVLEKLGDNVFHAANELKKTQQRIVQDFKKRLAFYEGIRFLLQPKNNPYDQKNRKQMETPPSWTMERLFEQCKQLQAMAPVAHQKEDPRDDTGQFKKLAQAVIQYEAIKKNLNTGVELEALNAYVKAARKHLQIINECAKGLAHEPTTNTMKRKSESEASTVVESSGSETSTTNETVESGLKNDVSNTRAPAHEKHSLPFILQELEEIKQYISGFQILFDDFKRRKRCLLNSANLIGNEIKNYLTIFDENSDYLNQLIEDKNFSDEKKRALNDAHCIVCACQAVKDHVKNMNKYLNDPVQNIPKILGLFDLETILQEMETVPKVKNLPSFSDQDLRQGASNIGSDDDHSEQSSETETTDQRTLEGALSEHLQEATNEDQKEHILNTKLPLLLLSKQGEEATEATLKDKHLDSLKPFLTTMYGAYQSVSISKSNATKVSIEKNMADVLVLAHDLTNSNNANKIIEIRAILNSENYSDTLFSEAWSRFVQVALRLAAFLAGLSLMGVAIGLILGSKGVAVPFVKPFFGLAAHLLAMGISTSVQVGLSSGACGVLAGVGFFGSHRVKIPACEATHFRRNARIFAKKVHQKIEDDAKKAANNPPTQNAEHGQ